MSSAPMYGFRALSDDLSNVPYSTPHYEVREGDHAARIEIDVPRYSMDDITINADGPTGTLTVRGCRMVDRDAGEYRHLVVSTSPLSEFQRTFRFLTSVYDVSRFESTVHQGVLTIVVPKIPMMPVVHRSPQPQRTITLFGDKESAEHSTPAELQRVWSDRRNVMSIKSEHSKTGVITYHVQLSPYVSKEHVLLELSGRLLIVTVRYHSQTETSENSMTYSNELVVPAGTRAEDIHTVWSPGELTIALWTPIDAPPSAIPVTRRY